MAALQRRRYSGRSLTLPLVLAVLLFLAVLSFLAPPLVDSPSFPNPNRSLRRLHHQPRPPVALRNSVELKRNAEALHVPSGGGSSVHDLWGSKRAKYYYGCNNSSLKFQKADAITETGRYLMIATSGGLNQQRTGITDAVVAARILNATLVVPKLDEKSFWKDSSNFTEIFDVDWFISSLSRDVKIVKELPSTGRKNFIAPYVMRVPRKCTARCYQSRVLPVLTKKHVVQLTKFDYRLANKLDDDLQKLRCRVNYHALRFTDSITEMGEKLIERMRKKSKHFIALHLRFEPDMLAFSGCYYGGGEKERNDLAAIRKRWKTLHMKNPDKERRQGRCPLTPEEVGLMLRALGFGYNVYIYVASGDVYGGEVTLGPLRALFPNFYTKESLATKEELAPFSSFSSRMAALDFMVCDGSDVFVTNNNGNMARILAGRRRYFGHKRTIRPNAKKLYSLFLNRANLTWEAFASKIRIHQRGFMGDPKEVRPGRGEFHENPSTCICESPEAKLLPDRGSRSRSKSVNKEKMGSSTQSYSELLYENFGDDDPERHDVDDAGDESLEMGSFNRTDSDDDLFIRSEDPEIEEMLSD